MHGDKFLAITNNMNNYAGVRQFADWSKTAVNCNLKIGVNDNRIEKKHSRRIGFGIMLFTT